MVGFLILFGGPAVLAFGAAWFLPRFATWVAWLIGLLPAGWLATENAPRLSDPLVLFYLLVFAVPSVAGALSGALLARRLARGRG